MANNNTPVPPPLSSPLTNELDATELRLRQLRLAREEREELLYQEAQESIRKSRQAGIDTVRMQMRQQELSQANCGHLKENGRTHLAGQKDHSGTLHLICQKCQKSFIGNQIPASLLPPMDTVGGPHNA